MSDGEEPVAEPTLQSLNADMRAQSSLLRELATAVAQLTARDRVVDGEGANGSGLGQRFAGQPTGSGGAAERPDLLELAQSGLVGAKSVSAEDDYLAVPELLQRAESGYEAVRPEEYLWMSCFGAHMAALFVALDELLPYVPATNQDFTPYLARARNHAEAIDKAFRFRLAFLRKLNEIKRRLQLQVAGVGEDVAADVDVAAKDAFGSDELGQRTLDLLSSSLSAQTLKSYAGRLSQFAEFCHDSENISPLEATTATVVRYVAWIGERGHIAAKSLQPYLSAINTFFELHNLVPIAKDSLHLTSARQSHLNYRALLAAVVNFLFFARGLIGVSCRVQDVHVDTYNITLQIYREKGRAGRRRGPGDLRVLLLPVSEHSRVARLLHHFIDNVQSVPLGGVPFPGEVSPRLANTLRVLNAVGFLAVAVVNAASSRFLPNSIGEVSDDNGTPITPSGYAFSIWGLIYLFQGALFFVYQWMPCANRQLLFHRIGFWHLALCAFNIGWIFTFSYAELELSAAVIWAMLTCLTAIYLRIHTHYGSQLGPKAVREQRTWLEYLCVYVPWSLYTSWLLGASLINVFLAIGSPSEEMLYGGLAALAAAAFVNLMILAWTRDVWFAAVNVWALVAIADKQVALPAIWGAAVALAGVVGAAACVTWAANIWDLIARWRAAPPHKADGEHTQFVVSSKV
eukprot:jgi/Tetstr1/441814/TSEL_030031.t1